MKTVALMLLLSIAALAVNAAPPQQDQPVPLLGSVVEVNAGARSVRVKSDEGVTTVVRIDDHTACLRIPAGEKSLSKATPIQFADIAIGDRVLGHGKKNVDDFLAQRLIVLSESEVEKKREGDLEAWRQRGIGGIVREINSQTGEIGLELRGTGAGGRVMINSSGANFRRYTPGSLRFEDAAASNLAELKAGDQLRALGEKSADGRALKAETIVSGAFKTIGVTVTEVDLQNNQLKVTTLDQKSPMVISILKDTTLSRIPPAVATTLAQKAATASRPPAGGSAPPQAANSAARQSIDVQQVIDSLPKISSADLKAGDVLAVTGAVEKDPSRLTAIKLVAGVDLVLKAMAPQPGRPQAVRLSAGLPSVFDFSVVQ